MGYSQVVRGLVGRFAHGTNVPNAKPDQAGLASVNPIFTWVRLAQRVPVHIHIDQVTEGVPLVAGTTATVQIDSQHEIAVPGILATSEGQPEHDRKNSGESLSRMNPWTVASVGRYEI
jgi:multidrug resistance efflux pump